MKPNVITADLAVGRATVAGKPNVKIAVPVLIHRDTGLIWQSDEVFPLWDTELSTAGQVLERLYQTAVLHWPEVAGATDWWHWRFAYGATS